MELAPDMESFVRAPLGRYVHGAGWLCFYATPHLSGVSVWGTVEASAVQRATVITPWIHRAGASPRIGLIDARRVDSADPGAFRVAASYVRHHRAAIASLIDRVAILHRPGLLSSVAAGFFSMLDPPYPVRSFADLEEAFAWINLPDVGSVVGELDRILRTSESALRSELRALLARSFETAQSLSPPTLASCARQLGVSARTLQRRLEEAGSSFRGELATARVERAKELLCDPALSVGEIASRVLTTEQQLSRLFHRMVGQPPARWRRQR